MTRPAPGRTRALTSPAPISILATEGIRLLSEKYLRKRYRDGVRATLEWVARRDAAIAAGMPFNEPPPEGLAPVTHNGSGSGHNGSGNGATASAKPGGNGTTATALKDVATNAVDEAMTEFVQWSVRKSVAEALGQPFDEPHPFSGNGANAKRPVSSVRPNR